MTTMFKQLTAYHTGKDFAIPSAADIEAALRPKRHLPIGLTQEKSVGFYPPRGEEHDPLVEAIGSHYIMRLNIETKSVPSRAIQDEVAKRCKTLEEATGRKPGKKERRDIAEDALLALLPAAFPKLHAITIWIDPERRLLALNTASQGKCDEAISALCHAFSGFSVSLIQTTTNPQAAMTQWLLATDIDSWPENLTVERECVLQSTGEEAATVKFNRHHLANDDVRKHVLEGKLPTQLALSWDSRAAFVLTDTLRLKKLQLLDGVLDASGTDKMEDRFDGDAALSTGLLGPLLDDLICALGGEMEIGEAKSDAVTPAQFDGDEDPLYEQAAEIVTTHRKASISLVQRHLKIGYNRAASLLEAMEKKGIVSPTNGMGYRTVLKGGVL
jgi:recombination associated protein RdgC